MGREEVDPFGEQELRSSLKTEQLGKTIYLYPSLESTNLLAKQLAEKGEKHGALVISETQTKGQGRLGRSWHSPPGGLWFSLILRPDFSKLMPQHLTFIAGLAVVQACSKIIHSVSLRWPNDLYVENKKLGGILTESRAKGDRFEYFIMGIGLNVNLAENQLPEELKPLATSLYILKKEQISRAALLGDILLHWEKILNHYPHHGFAPIVNSWKKHADFLGAFVKVDTPAGIIKGTAVDLSPSGALMIQDQSGLIHEISCGDVRLLSIVRTPHS